MDCGRPLCRRDNGPSSGNPGRPTGQVCAAQVEVRPHNAEWSPGRASHHQISPIKCGLQPIMTAQGRIRGRMPILRSLSAAGRTNPGNPGLSTTSRRIIGWSKGRVANTLLVGTNLWFCRGLDDVSGLWTPDAGEWRQIDNLGAFQRQIFGMCLDVLRIRLVVLSEATIIEIESDPNFDPSTLTMSMVRTRIGAEYTRQTTPECFGSGEMRLMRECDP